MQNFALFCCAEPFAILFSPGIPIMALGYALGHVVRTTFLLRLEFPYTPLKTFSLRVQECCAPKILAQFMKTLERKFGREELFRGLMVVYDSLVEKLVT